MKQYKRLSVAIGGLFSWYPPGIFFLAYEVSWWYMFLMVLLPVLIFALVAWYEFYGPSWTKTPAVGPFKDEYRSYP